MPKFTAEEHKLDEQDTLDMLRQGINQHVIASELGKSVQYINNIKKDLVKRGIITDAQIREFQILAFDTKILELMVTGQYLSTIIRECKTTREKVIESVERMKNAGKIPDGVSLISNNSEEKSKHRNQNMERLLELISKDVPLGEIYREIGVSDVTLYKYATELIEKGRLDASVWEETKQKSYKAKAHSKAVIIFNDEHYKQIIDGLKKGYTPEYIAKLLNVNVSQIREGITYLRDNGYVDQKEILAIRRQKNERNKKRILNYIRNGYSLQEITDKIDGVLYKNNYIRQQIKQLIAEGELTEKEYEEYQKLFYNAKKIKRFVLTELKKGATYEEIAQAYGNKFLTPFGVKQIKNELVKVRKITEKEISDARKKRVEDHKDKMDSLVLKMLREGKTVKNIVENDESGLLTIDRVRKAKKRLITEGAITEEEISNAKKIASVKSNEEIDELILGLLLQGKTHNEILAEHPYIGRGILVESKKRLYASGRINDQVLEQITETRKGEKVKKKISSLSNFDEELIMMLKRGFTLSEIMNSFNLSEYLAHRYIEDVMKRYNITDKDIRKFKTDCRQQFRELRKATIKGTDTGAINKFFDIMTFYVNHGRAISLEDIEILENAMLINQDCVLPKNLKLIIMQHIKFNRLNRAKLFIDRCISEYQDCFFLSSLEKFRAEIKREENKVIILRLAKEGFSTSAIAYDLRISEIDVIQTLKEYSKIDPSYTEAICR